MTARPNTLDRAIYSTVAYRDIFHFPVTPAEIHRYLHGVRCDLDEVQACLASSSLLERHLENDGEFFALRGRSATFAIRRERRALSLAQRPRARRFARFLASLPNIRMVALTGSLAAGNFPPDGDIDFLLVTDSGTMWRTRALCRMLALLDEKLRQGLFCPNTFLSAAALPLARHSLYDAQELSQMVPLHGLAEYRRLRAANSWTEEWLPNAPDAPEDCEDNPPYARGLKRAFEAVLAGGIGRAIEDFEARRKIHRFNETDRLKGTWTRSTREAHSMWDDMRLKIEGAWRERLDALE